MSRRLALFLTIATGRIRTAWTVMGLRSGVNGAGDGEDAGMWEREAATRAAEIQELLQLAYPRVRWEVTFGPQRRAIVDGPLDSYVFVKGWRPDGSSLTSVRILWRDVMSHPSSGLVGQIGRGLALDG